MSAPRTPGWVYVLASVSHPGIVKIGRTSRHTPGRMLELDQSAAYAAFSPWREVWSRAVSDCVHVETAAHRMLGHRRVRRCRMPCAELFRVDPAEACRVVEAAAGSLIVRRSPLPALVRARRGRSWPGWRWPVRRGHGRRLGRAVAGCALLLALMALLRDAGVSGLLAAMLRP